MRLKREREKGARRQKEVKLHDINNKGALPVLIKKERMKERKRESR